MISGSTDEANMQLIPDPAALNSMQKSRHC
jgi:hypothetical protein